MLKEESNKFPETILDYVQSSMEDMPRASLRYTIKKLHEDSRKKQ